MSTYLSTPYLFAFAVYASIFMLALLILFARIGRAGGSRWSAIGLLLSVCIVCLLVFVGDWKIADCRDAEGNLISELPQCRFLY